MPHVKLHRLPMPVTSAGEFKQHLTLHMYLLNIVFLLLIFHEILIFPSSFINITVS